MTVKARPADPIVRVEDIEALKKYMLNSSTDRMVSYRHYMLVVLGVNLGLRASDLCKLRIGDFKGTHLDLKEKKTDKRRLIYINNSVRTAIQEYKRLFLYVADEAYIFATSKSSHVQPKHVHKLIKKACRELGLKGNYGSHTLRKTMAYHVLLKGSDNPEIVKEIMIMFNHTREDVTRRYLVNSGNTDGQYEKLNL